MDLPDFRFRRDNEPPPGPATGGRLSGEDHDHNLDEIERVFAEIDAEFVKKADAVPLDPENPAHIKEATVDGDLVPIVDSEAEVAGTTKLTTKAQFLASTQTQIDDLGDQIGDIETILASI